MSTTRNNKRRRINQPKTFLGLPIDSRDTISKFLTPKESIMIGTTNQLERQRYLKSQQMHCDAEAKSGCEYCTLSNDSRPKCEANCLKSKQQCKRNSVLGPVPMCRQHMKMVGLDTTLKYTIPVDWDIKAIIFKHDIKEADMREAKLTDNRVLEHGLSPSQQLTLTFKKPKHISFKYKENNGEISVTFTTIKLIDHSQTQSTMRFECFCINNHYTPLLISIFRRGENVGANVKTRVPKKFDWRHIVPFRDSGLTQHYHFSTKIAFLMTKIVRQAFQLHNRQVRYDWEHIWRRTMIFDPTDPAYIQVIKGRNS